MAKLIRMVNPTDPNARADGFAPHPKGGILVSEGNVAALQSHGFLPETVEDIGKRADEAAARTARVEAIRQRRAEEGLA